MADQRSVILLLLCTCLTIEAAPVQPPEFVIDGNISAAEVKDPKVKFFLQELKKNTTKLDQLAAAGNVKEIANVLSSIADVAYQLIRVLPGDPPTLSFECVHNCDSKLNPAHEFILKGKGKSKGNKRIQYRWEVKRCPTEHDCTAVKKVKLESYSSEVLENNGTSLNIKPEFFEVGIYKIILFGKVEGGIEGSSTVNVTVNEPPKGGHCEVKPKEGKPLDPYFNVSCKGFHDDDTPLQYEFFYTDDLGTVQPKYKLLGYGSEPNLTKISLLSGREKYDYKLKFFAIVTDSLGASKKVDIEPMVTVKKLEFSIEDLQKKATQNLDQLAVSGNVKETANVVATIATVLNQQKAEEKSADDIEESKKLREKLAAAVVSKADVTSFKEVARLSSILSAVTASPEENTEKINAQVSPVLENVSEAILREARGETTASEKIEEAADDVFGAAANIILSENKHQNDEQSVSSKPQQTKEASENITRKALKTINTLVKALMVSKVAGGEATTIEKTSMSVGVSREKVFGIGTKLIATGQSEVSLPSNQTAFGNSSLDRVVLLSAINLFAGEESPGQIKNNLTRLFFYESKVNISRVAFNSSQISVAFDSAINKTKTLIEEQAEGAGHEVHQNSSWPLTATSEDGSVVNHL